MKYLSILALVFSFAAYAGGTIGGGSGGLAREQLLLSTADAAFNIDALPKTFVDPSDFRRAQARLSVDGVKTIPMVLNGESIDVRSIRGSIVDKDLSKEILAVDGGSTGGSPGAQ
jgi:hypothetical protein